MDDVDRVIAACRHADTATAHAWFTLLCQVHAEAATEGARSVTDLVERIVEVDRSALHRSATEALLAVLVDVSSPLELLADAGRYGPDQLTYRYEALLAQADAAQAASAQPAEDPGTWNAYLAANGPAWDGAEQSWARFRDWFARHAVDVGVGNAASTFLHYVESRSDKIAAFAEYGLVITPVPEDGFADGELAALFAEPDIDDIGAELAELDAAQLAALAADVAAELGQRQDR